MMFVDLNLKASDEDAMIATLMAAGFIKDKRGGMFHNDSALLLLPPGMVTRQTGEVQVVGGVEVAVRETVPGYHANVRTTNAELAVALEPVTVVVESPQYVWA